MGNYDHLTLADGSPLTDLEKWVLEQVKLGEIADFKKQFGAEEANRLIRAKFMEELLTDGFQGFTPHRRGIKIAHGIIAEPLDLENAEVGHIVALVECIFQQVVNLRDSRFIRLLVLNGSNFGQKTDFQRINVNISLSCRGAVFRGPVDFLSADIRGQLIADGAHFQGQEANFNGIKIAQSAFFDFAIFQGPADFRGAEVGGQLIFRGARFQGQGRENQANFNGIKVGHGAYFDNATFQGPIDFRGSVISGELGAKEVRFEGQGQENKANFSAIKVGKNAFFNGAVFQGPVDFGGADIGGQFIVRGAQFQGQGQQNQANFNGMRVGLSAIFENAVFLGTVDFRSAEISGEFNVKEARFQAQGQQNHVIFNSIKVGSHALFDGAFFHGPVDFTMAYVSGSLSLIPLFKPEGILKTTFEGPVIFPGAQIGGQFVAHQAEFKSKEGVKFEGFKVGQSAFFTGTAFDGPLAMNHAHLLDLRMCGNNIIELNLENTRIDRELRIERIEIDKIRARNLAVNGSAILENMNFTEEIDLRDASFQSLELIQVNWPAKPHRVWLEGLTYKAISAGDKLGDWRKLLGWVEGSRFNTQNYSQLEAYFTRCGHRDRADAVFITGKREAANRLTWGKKWLTRIFWGLLTGYGRKPWQVLYVIAPLVLLGAILFSPEFGAKFMESHQYLNFFPRWIIKGTLSLDRFLPGVNLGLAEHWQPQQLGLGIWLYWYALKIFGWITIPIALAAIYTRIK